jgi:hypothetical protein
MTTEAAAPAAEATEAPQAKTSTDDAKPAKSESKEERKAATKNKLREYLANKAAAEEAEADDFGNDEPPAKQPSKKEPAKAKAEAKPTAKTTAKEESAPTKAAERAEAKVDKIEELGGDAPDQKKNESDSQYDIRLAKTLRDLRDAKAEALKATKEAAQFQGEARKLQKILDEGKANPLKVLEHLGITYEDLTKGIVEEKYKPAHKRNDLPPEILEKIERLEAKEKEREAEAVRASAQAQRSQHVSAVQKYIDDNSEDYPLAATMKWVAEDVVARGYATGGEFDALPILQELESNLAANVGTLLGSDKATKALLKKNPALKKALEAAMGLEAAAKKREEEDEELPISVAMTSTEAPTRTKLSRAEMKARLAADLKRRNAEQLDSDDED